MTDGPSLRAGTYVGNTLIYLTDMLSVCLLEAEGLLGPRDMTWTIVGVDIGEQDYPQTYYPIKGIKHVKIALARSVGTQIQALYQLSHEVIHLLNPRDVGGVANTLEEGVATWFSAKVSQRALMGYTGDPGLHSYRRAMHLAKPLMDQPERLRQWREDHPGLGLSDISAEDLLLLYPNLTPHQASELFFPFDRDLQEPT